MAGVAETTGLWLPDETPAPGSIEGTAATSGPKWRVFDAHGISTNRSRVEAISAA